MKGSETHRILVVCDDPDRLRLLGSILDDQSDCRLDNCATRLLGVRQFRTHRQPIVIIDAAMAGTFPRRLFGLMRKLRRHVVTVVAAFQAGEIEGLRRLGLGSREVLDFSGDCSGARETLLFALEQARLRSRSLFRKHMLFHAALMLPVWAALVWLLAQG